MSENDMISIFLKTCDNLGSEYEKHVINCQSLNYHFTSQFTLSDLTTHISKAMNQPFLLQFGFWTIGVAAVNEDQLANFGFTLISGNIHSRIHSERWCARVK